MTLEQTLAAYLAPHAPGSATHRTYRQNAEAWTTWCAAQRVDPLHPTVGECVAYQQHWLDRSRSNATVRQRVRGASALLATAIRIGTITGPNPWDEIRAPAAARQSTTKFLTPEQHRQLVAWLGPNAGAHTTALIRLMVVLGLRVHEAIGFRIDGLTDSTDAWTYRYRQKGGGDVTITIDDETVDAIMAARGERTSGYLFASSAGDQPIDRTTAARWLRNACVAAGVPVVPPHGLRRTVITELLSRTGDASLAQQFAHHADARTTMIYDMRQDRQAQGLAIVVDALREDPTHG